MLRTVAACGSDRNAGTPQSAAVVAKARARIPAVKIKLPDCRFEMLAHTGDKGRRHGPA